MPAEIISTIERRRHWPDEEKLRAVSEALKPGAIIASIADRNGVCRSLLYTWLRLAREDRLPGFSLNRTANASFLPVRIAPPEGSAPALAAAPSDPASSEMRSALNPRRRMATVAIVLGNGRIIKADEAIDPAVLARLVAALDDNARLRPAGAVA
jgi:transposase